MTYGKKAEPEDTWLNTSQKLSNLSQQAENKGTNFARAIRKVVLKTGYIGHENWISEDEALMGFDLFQELIECEQVNIPKRQVMDEFLEIAAEQGLNFNDIKRVRKALRKPQLQLMKFKNSPRQADDILSLRNNL